MKSEMKKYVTKKLVIFSIDIKQKKHKSGKWKKDVTFPSKWTDFTFKNSFADFNYNGVAIITGKINNLIIIDIDNVDHWNKLLKENNQTEPDTVKVISGSGGIHYYFKYDAELENIKSKDHCFSKEYDIDIKTNGGCIIAPPTKYFNKNLDKDVEYKWGKSIFDHAPSGIPIWIKKLLLNKTIEKTEVIEVENVKIKSLKKDIIKDCGILALLGNANCEIDEQDKCTDFTCDHIEQLVDLLSLSRCDTYNDWVNIGMCLFNIDNTYLYIWRNWSRKSNKYEIGSCESKWKSFKKSKDGLSIGSLLLWCKTDKENEYGNFMSNYKMKNMIIAKFPNDNLEIGKIIDVNDVCKYIKLDNNKCLINGFEHHDLSPSMYIEMIKDLITIKCCHPDCFGKTYCNHRQLTKQETNFIFNGNINININTSIKDDELVEFEKMDVFDDDVLNEIVYNGLNGEATPQAEIVHYFNKYKFNYGEDNDWYIFENHKWKNMGTKNIKLRYSIKSALTDTYGKLFNHYKKIEKDKKKINTLRQIIKSFDNTNLKNNIITELIDIYSENNNVNRDFTKKLDSKLHLIGFNNGVYDLKNFEFRNGRHDDYITMSVNYDYLDMYTDKHKDLINFLNDIQPDKIELDYMLTYLSIGLMGNKLELFTILTGCGRNGKSKLIELLKLTLGDYFGSVQSQLFTRPRPDANAPDPGLLSLIKKKIVIASEPEKNDKLNSGFIKFLTGRDSTTLRTCHSNDMIDFTANFITLLVCNDIPECDDMDNALSLRLRCIHFPTQFVTNPTKTNQKMINEDINKNFEFWKTDFMLLLIEYYKKYMVTRKLIDTPNILKWTDKYKDDTDIYLKFLNECTNESDTHVHMIDLYNSFKIWFKNNNPYIKIYDSREFNKGIKKHKDLENVRVDNKVLLGIKSLNLIDI